MKVLVVPVSTEAVEKALNTSKLVKKRVVINRGGKTYEAYRWTRPGEAAGPDQVKTQEVKDPEDVRGSKHGYGIHRINNGDTIAFKVNGAAMMGSVVDDSATDSVLVQTDSGEKFKIGWNDIFWFKGDKPAASSGKEEPNQAPGQVQGQPAETVDPQTFAAAEWSKQYDDPNATAESILDEMEKTLPGVREEISKTEQRLKSIEQTISVYRKEGEGAAAIYAPERLEKHAEILNEIFSMEKLESAMPAPGEKPVLIMLGGRGGSGKSWFGGKVYDKTRAIVLDADEIKGKLNEYEGWNAAQVHEESSDILEKAISSARKLGLNVVLDATMKTTKSALKKVEYFKDAGYSIEAHYMYCPRQEAAKRAVGRFMGKSKRYVPVDIVLSNTTNESTFDEVRKYADSWSFYNNSKGGGGSPVLVSESGKRRFSDLLKSLISKNVSKMIYSKAGGNTMKSKERKDAKRFDEYDNGPVTPDDKLAPDVKELIAKLSPSADKIRQRRGSGK